MGSGTSRPTSLDIGLGRLGRLGLGHLGLGHSILEFLPWDSCHNSHSSHSSHSSLDLGGPGLHTLCHCQTTCRLCQTCHLSQSICHRPVALQVVLRPEAFCSQTYEL